jgi:hypothetical protein
VIRFDFGNVVTGCALTGLATPRFLAPGLAMVEIAETRFAMSWAPAASSLAAKVARP